MSRRNGGDIKSQPRCMIEMDNMQPYKGGFGDWAWKLHQLDIVDKHRPLLTVATVPVARSMTASERMVCG